MSPDVVLTQPQVAAIPNPIGVTQGTIPWICQMEDIVDAGNSTTTPLASGATFTGTGRSTLGFSEVQILVKSDQPSAANGITIQFSSDNAQWIDASPFTYTPGSGFNVGQAFICGVRGQYCRVSYINSGTNQGNFILQTVLRGDYNGADILSVNGTVNDNNHGELVIAQIIGKTTGGGGGYVPVKVNPSGTLVVDASGTTVPVSQTGAPWSVSQSGTWNVGVNAGTNLIGQVSSSAETSTVYNGSSALTPLFANITPSASGDSTVIAAVASHIIRVLSLKVIANATNNVFFRSGTGGTQLDGTAYLAANGGYILPFSPIGWFQTASGAALVINLSAASNVGITVVYVTI
jgi:hypothetical protein